MEKRSKKRAISPGTAEGTATSPKKQEEPRQQSELKDGARETQSRKKEWEGESGE